MDCTKIYKNVIRVAGSETPSKIKEVQNSRVTSADGALSKDQFSSSSSALPSSAALSAPRQDQNLGILGCKLLEEDGGKYS